VSDESLKNAILEAALTRAASEGFTDAMLGKAAAVAGAAEGLARLFPQGVPSLLEFYSQSIDVEMEKRLAALDLLAMPVRKRIRTAVLTRLDILKAHKEAARRAAAHLSFNPPLTAKLIYATVDKMWRAAGDTSTNFNFYTKRAILAGVYSGTLMRWFGGADEHETAAFLDARIENVMQYEKLKVRLRKQTEPLFDMLLRR
jgi:ubiquinone biosynthesis protein COQ9